jgi:hypothetical protein
MVEGSMMMYVGSVDGRGEKRDMERERKGSCYGRAEKKMRTKKSKDRRRSRRGVSCQGPSGGW